MSIRSLPWFSLCRFVNGLALAAVALTYAIGPAVITLNDLRDPGLHGPHIPQAAWRLHRSLTPRYQKWATDRLASSRAAELSLENISGTEWPLFGSVFYLWGTEALQAEWEANPKLYAQAPKIYARAAIDAATRQVIDPSQAAWVKTHWGANYLKTQNVFYRMLVMAALVSHARLTGDTQYLPMLRDQVESFATELDATPHGLMDDYPGECYPVDVLAALAMIHEADPILGTDHSAFLRRARRGFAPPYLDEYGLVPYRSDSKTGKVLLSSRGCGNSDTPMTGALLWPDLAQQWYDIYAKHFWQQTWLTSGFREFPADLHLPDSFANVDSGPVVQGFGFAASAFGAGAARAQGHFEHAYPITAEILAASYPLPNGTLLIPRACSNAVDAPYLGEAGILYSLTRTPAKDVALTFGGRIPNMVWIILGVPLLIGLELLVCAWRHWRSAWRYRRHLMDARCRRTALGWVGLVLATGLLWVWGWHVLAPALAAIALFLPRRPLAGAR